MVISTKDIKPEGTFEISHYIGSSDVDFCARVSLSTLFELYQDIAATHAGILGASVVGLKDERHSAWILMRIRVEIDKYPVLAENVLLKTWPQKPRAIYARDYLIRDEATGEVLVRAASDWIIMNLDEREIVRKPLTYTEGIVLDENRALPEKMRKMKAEGDFHFVYDKEIKYSDIDYNEHVNNANYVDYIMDCIPIERHRQGAPKAIEVHYVSEAEPGEILEFAMTDEDDDGKRYVVGTSKTDGRQIFTSVLEYRK
jgi:acyl-ACP thioesterase